MGHTLCLQETLKYMRKKLDSETQEFFWVDFLKTKSEVEAETKAKFEPIQNDQLKALMLQVEQLCKKARVPLHPAFEEALKQRSAIIEEHLEKKAQAEPD